MKIVLTNPCTVSQSELVPNCNGGFCNHCQKQVVDYSLMGDDEFFKSIKKHGIGCGQFRDDQLDREIASPRRKKVSAFMYMPLFAAFFSKPISMHAQSVPDTMQMPGAFKNDIKPVDVKQEDGIVAVSAVNKRFGTGHIEPANYVKPKKKIRINLFRRKVK